MLDMKIVIEKPRTQKQLELVAYRLYECAQAFEHALLVNGECIECEGVGPICCGDIVEQSDGSLAYENGVCSACCPSCSSHHVRGGFDEDDSFDDGPDFDSGIHFADPGGTSALRAATPTNPRNQPCPDCGDEDVLTPLDVACGYVCDRCANRNEGMGGY